MNRNKKPNQFQLTQILETQISPDRWNQFSFVVANLQTRTSLSSQVLCNQEQPIHTNERKADLCGSADLPVSARSAETAKIQYEEFVC
ncbi:hypothetical protein PS1_009930 [Malus domestica]